MFDGSRAAREGVASEHQASTAATREAPGPLGASPDDDQSQRVGRLPQGRFEDLRLQPEREGPRRVLAAAVSCQRYAEPGSTAARLNLLECVLAQREESARRSGEAIRSLLAEVSRLAERCDDLEARGGGGRADNHPHRD